MPRRSMLALAALVAVSVGCGREAARDAGVTTGVTPSRAPSTAPAERSEPATALTATSPPVQPTTLVVSSSAVATAPATRVQPPAAVPQSVCEQIATRLASDHAGASQFVVVRTTAAIDTTAILQVAERSGTGWTCGREMVSRVGRSGVRPLLERRSGDGTTPAGVFALGTMTAWDGEVFSFFGSSPDPGVTAGAYRRTRAGDCFGATPNAPTYGHLRNDSTCTSPDELLASIGAYTNAALIDANMEPDVSGDAPGEIPYAAAIFLHRFSYVAPGSTSGPTKPTSGCVSLAQGDLTEVLRQMRPGVHFAIGTTDWLLAGAVG